MSANADSVKAGEPTNSKIAPSEPIGNSGHQVTSADTEEAPEFHVQILKAGTAPPAKTHQIDPNATNQDQYDNAGETITGSTSKDVHKSGGDAGGQKSTGGSMGVDEDAKDAKEPATRAADIKSATEQQPVSADQL
ncbi:hypothetical protein P153DRAFT_400948 [Dothidotthia symphoricarpi CBS 119687]|uniref:Uncharacterized protein n=1 Tax=Dothidotthia symphoricarpi CBS 119687 TaxID=1392245 RepID=A0A6A6A2B4_9PLEO|nr:uncharacterized protein P153DRAFT_400948 [Dothidotthia symphoricarpi CBS 119687]KAF2124878.1 hypothetical protein P153DRAFT_400948 [Dothidotthia symphoricarpi CBS 119687]